MSAALQVKNLKRLAEHGAARIFSAAQVATAFLLLPIAKLSTKPKASSTRRILVISMGGIGDNVLALPAILALRKKYPEHEFILIVRPYSRGIESLIPGCINLEMGYASGESALARLLEPVRALRFILANDLNSRPELAVVPRWDRDNTGSAFLSFFSRAKCRLTFSEKVDSRKAAHNWLYDTLYTHTYKTHASQLEARKIADLVAKHENVPIPPVGSFLRRKAARPMQPKETLIAIAPFAGQPRRDWPPESWRRLLQILAAKLGGRARFLILCGRQEEHKAREIGTGQQKCSIMSGEKLITLVDALSNADLLIGADSGLAHLAGAAGVPVIQLFCHPTTGLASHYSSPARYTAAAPWALVIQPRANPGCEDACEASGACCIRNIDVDTVVSAAEGFFAKAHPDERQQLVAE